MAGPLKRQGERVQYYVARNQYIVVYRNEASVTDAPILGVLGAIDLHTTQLITQAAEHITLVFHDGMSLLLVAESIPRALQWARHLEARADFFRQFKNAEGAEKAIIAQAITKAVAEKAEMYSHETEKLVHTLEEHEEIAQQASRTPL